MNEVLVGIDFGTTNTVITIFENNKAVVLKDGVFRTIPSKIGFIDDKVYFGNYIPINCNNVIHSFKKIILESSIPDTLNSIKVTKISSIDDLLIMFFKHLLGLIQKRVSNQSIKAVITVPSNFNDKQREVIKYCFNVIGIIVIRIINEPSAAALAYGLNYSSKPEEKILVIDTGGGTMDFTVLEKNDLFFEVVHSEGLNNLGGNNFTDLIVQDIIKTCNLDAKDYSNILWNQSQKMKEKLTYLDVYETQINGSHNYVLTRIKFENLCNKLFNDIKTSLKNIVDAFPDISYIILVGGTSRIPALQTIIKETTNKVPWVHPNLETVVAEGAGLYAGIVDNKFTINEDVVLMDVLPLSLGVELVDGSYSVIIPKNTPLPVKRSQKYTTDSPGDTTLRVKVYQGERKIANKNFLIGEILFDKVSLGSVPMIEVSFKVDLNSIITVTIIDKKSGVEKNIVFKDELRIDTERINELVNLADKSKESDETELLKNQNIYMIKTHIENALQNLGINNLIRDEDKNSMLSDFNRIENSIYDMNTLQLVETLKYLQDNYSMLGADMGGIGSDIKETNKEDINSDLEKLFLNERKSELISRINILIARNPEWKEYLDPVLEELSYSNCTIDYINDKINTLTDLEDEEDRDYRQELNNLCLFLKSELESGTINVGPEKNKLLTDLINYNLDLLLNSGSNTDNTSINWEDQLNKLNADCEKLYNN